MMYIARKRELLVLASACLIITTVALYRYQNILLDQNIFRKIPLLFVNTIGDAERIHSQQVQNAISYRFDPVYYLWCTPRIFEFTNYLSVTSVIQYLNPDKVVFFYQYYPVMDSMSYNIWFHEIRQKYPFLEVVEAPASVCSGNASGQDFIRTHLKAVVGIQWEERAILTSHPSKFDALRIFVNKTKFFANCTSASSLDNERSLPLCVMLGNQLNPKDIWDLDSSFGRSIRKLFYGTEEILLPVPSYSQLIPNIGHVTWFGGGEMDFLFYLGMLSLIYVAEVDKVFIYGGAPKGYYWSLLESNPKIQVIPRSVDVIYGVPIRTYMHMSDILRVEILKKYGGIYLDTDAIVLKPFDREIRAYDVVVSLDGMPSLWGPFPDVINPGVMIGKKDAKFLDVFQETMKHFRDDDTTFSGCRRPYQLLERQPDLLRIDPHLQVTCFRLMCHPTWWPGYRKESVNHLNPNVRFDWRKDAYVIHWTSPNPAEYANPKRLLSSTGMFAEIGQHVLNKSNMTRFFENVAKTRSDW